MKKMLALLLVAVLAVSMLTACGKKDNTGDTTNTGSTSTTTTNTGSTDNGAANTINVWRATFNLGSIDDAEVKAVETKINDYLAKAGKSYKIALTDVQSGEYTEKANLALSNNEINLLWTASWESTIGTNDLTANGGVKDISALLPGTTLYTSIPEWVWKASQYDGKDYFISCYKESAEGYDVMVRSDLATTYGWDLSSIKKLADIEPMLADIKAYENIKYPYLTQKTAMFYRWYVDSFDFFTQDCWIGVDRSKNEVVNTVLTPEYKEFCTLMAKWAEAGYISEDDVNKVTTDTTTQTQDWGFTWWTCVPNDDEADSRYMQAVDTVSVTGKYSHSTTTLGSCWCITSNTSDAVAKDAIDFMGLVYTDKALADIFTFGIEGTDFEYVDGAVKTLENKKYNHSAWESCSVLCLSLTTEEPANKVQLYSDFNNSSASSVASGFRFDKSPVEAKYTACKAVFDEYGFILENGGVKVADVDSTIAAYAAALDAAGYQDVLAEFSKQYDAWKK